jgi:hypothetical protein
MRLTLALTLSLAACAASPDRDPAPAPGGDPPPVSDPGSPNGATARLPLALDGLEPGWLVTTTTMTDGAATAEATVVSDGSPISIAGVDGTRVLATVTDGNGALIATQTVRTPCATRDAHPLRVPSRYATIQAAIDAAHPGDTVAVAPGHYTESVVMRPGICLLGAGPSLTTLDARGEGRSLVDLSLAPGSTVSGFTFRGTTSQAGCATDDPFECAGDWRRAGVFVSGEGVGGTGLNPTTAGPGRPRSRRP